MRPALLVAAVLVAVPLAACSSGSSTTAGSAPTGSAASSASSSDASSPASSPGSASTPAATGGGQSAGPASGPCAALSKADLTKYLVYTQILAQVTDQASLDAIKAGTPGDFTPAKLDAILAKMSFVQDQGASAVDFFLKADASLEKLLAGKPTVAQIQAFVAQTGGVPGVLQQQLVLNQAIGTTCPTLR